MAERTNQVPPSSQQLHDYAEVRGLVEVKNYPDALERLNNSELNISTKEQLKRALESKDDYIIERTFTELDARVMQALCWDCWRD